LTGESRDLDDGEEEPDRRGEREGELADGAQSKRAEQGGISTRTNKAAARQKTKLSIDFDFPISNLFNSIYPLVSILSSSCVKSSASSAHLHTEAHTLKGRPVDRGLPLCLQTVSHPERHVRSHRACASRELRRKGDLEADMPFVLDERPIGFCADSAGRRLVRVAERATVVC